MPEELDHPGPAPDWPPGDEDPPARRGGTLRRLPTLLRAAPATVIVGLVTFAFFLLEYAAGGTTDPAALLRLGALRPDLVLEQGELFRLLMPMLLHGGALHLLMNGLAYLQLMLITEHLYGSSRALVFYVLCGLGGTLGTTLFGPDWLPASVGASGAILGLAGVLLGTSAYGREPWRTRLRGMVARPLLMSVLFTFAVGIGLSTFLLTVVDNWAHAGGLFAGFLIAAVQRDPDQSAPRLERAAAALVVAAGVACIGWTAVAGGRVLDGLPADTAHQFERRAELDPDGMLTGVYLVEMVKSHHRAGTPKEGRQALRARLAEATSPTTPQTVAGLLFSEDAPSLERELGLALERWVALSPEDPVALNSLAWHLVTRRDEERRDPVRAEELARASLSRLTDADRELRAATLDTHAEALAQLGRYAEALPIQREAVALGEQVGLADLPAMRRRLARIESALHAG